MTDRQIRGINAEIARLRTQNDALKASSLRAQVSMKVSEKGGVSVCGLGDYPVTLYREQWLKLLAAGVEINTFIADNKHRLKREKSGELPAWSRADQKSNPITPETHPTHVPRDSAEASLARSTPTGSLLCATCRCVLNPARVDSHLKSGCPAKRLLKNSSSTVSAKSVVYSEAKSQAARETAAKREYFAIKRACQGGLPK